MGTSAVGYLPDGTAAAFPVDPQTWVDTAAGVRGTSLRAINLTYNAGGAVMWHRQRPLFQAFQPGAQSIPSSTWTAITGLAELIDNWSGHSDSTNTGRYYAPATVSSLGSGDWYLVTGYVPFNSTDGAHVHIAGLRVNGAGTIREGAKVPSGTGHAVDTMVMDLVQLNGNTDYVELCGWQNTGSAVNTVVSSKGATITCRWVAADPAWSGAYTPALPAAPHVWTSADTYTGTATGGAKVPLNTELRDRVRFLNNPPVARLTSSGTAQTIPTGSGTWTSVNMTSSGNLDTYTGWAIGQPSRYVCQRAGLYMVAGNVSVTETATGAGYRAARLLQTFAAGGTQSYAGWTTRPQTTGTTGTNIYAHSMLRMAVGDYVEVQMQHTQGASLSLNSSAGGGSRLIAVWMAK